MTKQFEVRSSHCGMVKNETEMRSGALSVADGGRRRERRGVDERDIASSSSSQIQSAERRY
jgi:hypothetical protein